MNPTLIAKDKQIEETHIATRRIGFN